MQNKAILLFWLWLAILALAYGLRVYGAWSSIEYIPDTQLIRQAFLLGQRLTNLDEYSFNLGSDFKYPLTLTFYLFIVYGVAFVWSLLTGQVGSLQAFENILFTNRADFHLIAVLCFAVISTALVPIMYVAIKRLNPRQTGWIGVGLVTFNLLLIHFSHHARPHIPLATFSFAAVALLVATTYGANWKWATLGTIVSALTLGTLQNGIVIALPFFLAWLFRSYDIQSNKFHWKKIFSRLTILNFALFIVLSVILYPALITEYGSVALGFLSGQSSQFNLGGGLHSFQLDSFGIHNIPNFLSGITSYQPLLVLLIVPATIYFVWRYRKKPRLLIVGGTFPVIQLFVWGLFSGSFPRITAVLTPFMIFLVAYFLEDLAIWVSRVVDRPRSWFVTGLCIMLFVPMGINAVRFNYVTAQEDTRSQASEWIHDNVPDGSSILVSGFQALELTPSREAIERQEEDFPGSLGTKAQWLIENNTLPEVTYDIYEGHLYWDNDPTILSDNAIDYALIDAAVPNPNDEIYTYLNENARLIQEFCPERPITYAQLPEDLFSDGWKAIWDIEYPGFIIAIYDLQQSPTTKFAGYCQMVD